MDKTTKPTRGRPPKLGKRKPLLVRLPEDVHESLRVAATETRASMTELVGTAVKEWLDRRRRK